MENGHCAFLSA